MISSTMGTSNKPLKTQRGTLQVNRSLQRHRARPLSAFARVCLISWLMKNMKLLENHLIRQDPTLHAFRDFSCHPRIQFDCNYFLCFFENLDCQVSSSRAYFKDDLLVMSIDFIAQSGRSWRLTSLCLRSALSTGKHQGVSIPL